MSYEHKPEVTRLQLVCICGQEHPLVVGVVHHGIDPDKENRNKRRRIKINEGWKQKARAHCECGRRIELLFKHGDGRR